MTIPSDALIIASHDQVSTSTGTDVVILELTNGIYYGLNEVGQSVWEILQEPVRVGTICDMIGEMYDVEPEICQRDIDTLLTSLLDHKLILVEDARTV